MSNQKLKSENYNSLGGINSKVSAYLNSPLEFLDIKNFDFQTPGALTQRWGSTQYMSQNFSGPITYLDEFQRLDGSSYVLVGVSGGLWSGATTGQSQGLSLTSNLVGISFIGGPAYWAYGGIGIGYIAYRYDDPSAWGSTILPVGWLFGSTSSGLYFNGASVLISGSSQSLGSNINDSVVLNNLLYICDENKFLKFDGTNTTNFGLPPPIAGGPSIGWTTILSGSGASYWFGSSGVAIPVKSTGGLSLGTNSTWCFYAQYVSANGFLSNIWPIAFVDASPNGITTTGSTLHTIIYQMPTPLAYGISSINLYSYLNSKSFASFTPTDFWNPQYVFNGNIPASGSTLTTFALGTTVGGVLNFINNIGSIPDLSYNLYQPLGITYRAAGVTSPQLGFITLNKWFPKYIESYQTRLFMSGLTFAQSSVYFSEVGIGEAVKPDNNFEVRSNDGDIITAMKAYGTRLYIFKKNSFYCLIGDSPSNFSLQEVSLNYGCLNNRCVVVYEQIMLFLDRKGLMIFNGASLECLSNKVQPIFDRMNYSAALDKACMIHDKLRNQILIAIPVDGATYNNITLVYDYFNKSWTTQDGYNPTVFASIQGRNNTKNVFYGTTLGTVNWFGASFTSDNGVGFTAYFKTRFLHDLGNSTESQFRRLYLDAQVGTTYVMPINFYQDYGASVVYSTTFVLSEFQRRIDFGIPAKAIAFELSKFQTDFPLKIYGFTIESRLQRRV